MQRIIQVFRIPLRTTPPGVRTLLPFGPPPIVSPSRRPSITPSLRLLLAVILLLVSQLHAAPPARNKLDLLLRDYGAKQVQFAADMQALADFCEANSFADDAARIRLLAAPVAEQTLDVDALPEFRQPDLPPGLPRIENEWRTRLRSLQTTYAQDVYLLSQRAVRDGFPSHAFEFIRETAFHDPDHRLARKALGYVPYENGWATPFAAERQRRGYVWHDRFGWLPRTQVERYENGERYYGGRWITAAKEASIRTDPDKAWEVLTEHFEIHTNHSLERGVELGVALEDFHRFFVREFAGFFNTPQQMQALFDPGSADVRGAANRHKVWYFRTREEYIAALQPHQQGIEVTNGLYMPGLRTAYFFDDPDNPDGRTETLFHEVTHQLFGESARSIQDVGADANFWIVEGIACYMESFDRESRPMTVGDPLHIRIHWARVRVVEEDFLVPLADFAAMGMREFQFGRDHATLQKYYSQASGLAHFFLHYEQGLYREALIAHLSQIYSPNARIRARVQGMDALTGVSYAELAEQYKDYAAALPALLDEPVADDR
jgi:hypothetical protein